MKSVLLSLVLFVSASVQARLPDEIAGQSGSMIASGRPNGASTDPSFLLDINKARCMNRAQEIMALFEYSFFLGPDARAAIAGSIQTIQRNPKLMFGQNQLTIRAYEVARLSLIEQGRATLSQSTQVECSSDENINMQNKTINDTALQILKSFVENPLQGR